jgi:hypothetical protein
MVDNGYLLYFRWLELLEEPRKDSGQVSLVVPINHHRHLQIWPRLWPGKPSFLTNLYKLKWAISVSNPEAERNPLSSSYQDFLSTQPPLFHKADEPLDADA